MRRLLVVSIFVLTLYSAPPALAASGTAQPLYAEFGRHFMVGARFYGQAISGWAWGLLARLGLAGRFASVSEGGNCTQFSRCAQGLVCLNTCNESSCPRFEKHCVIGPKTVPVLGASSICGADNLCADGTDCLRVCPVGAGCAATHRCVTTRSPATACETDTECIDACGKLPSPEIGPGGYAARCARKTCACDPVEIFPDAPRVPCPASEKPLIACPEPTFPACASGTNGIVYATCLRSPEYGGTCFQDAECEKALCPEPSAPFCDALGSCKCRTAKTNVVACTSASECAATACDPNETAACIDNACACAPRATASDCRAATDCSSECPEGYSAACEAGACVCQRTQQGAPVTCRTTDDCNAISCPVEYQKSCLNTLCSCTRAVSPR